MGERPETVMRYSRQELRTQIYGTGKEHVQGSAVARDEGVLRQLLGQRYGEIFQKQNFEVVVEYIGRR